MVKNPIKIVFLFLSFISSIYSYDSNNIIAEKYLKKYYKSKPFEIIKDKMIVERRTLFIALHYIKVDKYGIKIFDQGVVYEIKNNNNIIPYLFVDKGKIYNGNKKLIFNIKDVADEKRFYGWQFDMSDPNSPVVTFSFITYFDEGYNPSDPVTIEWDRKTKSFVYNEIKV